VTLAQLTGVMVPQLSRTTIMKPDRYLFDTTVVSIQLLDPPAKASETRLL
jgi:hypothetical protein